MFKKLFVVLVLSLLAITVQATTLSHYQSMLQPEQAKKDIEQWLEFVDKTHPDLGYTVKDIDGLYAQIDEFKNSISQPISVRDFWLKMMTFNSVMSDGHSSLTPTNRNALVDDYLKNGGTLFPFKVVFDDEKLIIKEKLNGEPSNLAGSEINKINGLLVHQVIEPLLARTHGDSHEHRKAILETRFSTYYWMYFGEQKEFNLDIVTADISISNIDVAATNKITRKDNHFASNFQFEVLNRDTGLLTVNTFLWLENESQVFEFFESSFKQIKEKALSHLIIDVRRNAGGDDHFWKQGIVPYIANKSWKTGSNYKAKVIAGRVREGQTEGDIMTGEISTIQQVKKDNPYKFDGKVSVLVSPYTYSSSILFTNTMQDHNFGQLVGDKTGGKSGQTGGIQMKKLTYSKLTTVVPRFWLTRPKGGHNLELIELDKTIQYDRLKPTQLIDKLLAE